jgi:hypothetical protein
VVGYRTTGAPARLAVTVRPSQPDSAGT